MDFLSRLKLMPDAALVSAGWVREQIEQERGAQPVVAAAPELVVEVEPSWRERLWTAPAETRIGVEEVIEAFGRPKSWLYRHTSAKPRPTIPCRKMDGALTFVVGELRAWARDAEEVLAAGPMESSRAERGLRAS